MCYNTLFLLNISEHGGDLYNKSQEEDIFRTEMNTSKFDIRYILVQLQLNTVSIIYSAEMRLPNALILWWLVWIAVFSMQIKIRILQQ